MLAIALIENLDKPDNGPNSGSAWVSDRRHHLLPIDGPLVSQIGALIGTDKSPRMIAEALVTLLKDQLKLMEGDIAIVDTEEITDAWPTAGDGTAWSGSIWCGLADYLSYRTWCRLMGRPQDISEYALSPDVALECVRFNSRVQVGKAREYLGDGDPIDTLLAQAIQKLGC